MNGLGWMLGSLDRLRSGEERLDDGYVADIGRGARPVGVAVPYLAGGVGAGWSIGAIARRSRANPVNTLIAGLMLIAASFVSSIGVIACGIGVVFTAPYALAMQAWIIRSFEIGSADRQAA